MDRATNCQDPPSVRLLQVEIRIPQEMTAAAKLRAACPMGRHTAFAAAAAAAWARLRLENCELLVVDVIAAYAEGTCQEA